MTAPTPEAIEAAEAAVRKYYSAGGWVRTADVAKLAVEAAYPLMEASAKAEALTAFADAHRMPFIMFNHGGQQVTISDLLRAQAAEYRATIEGKDS